MGICYEVYDKPLVSTSIQMGFIGEMFSRHGKYDNPFDLMAIELTDAPVGQTLREAIQTVALFDMIEDLYQHADSLEAMSKRRPSPGILATCR
jgi:hypothetical protein